MRTRRVVSTFVYAPLCILYATSIGNSLLVLDLRTPAVHIVIFRRMESIFNYAVIVLACCFAQQVSVDAATQAPMAATNGSVSTKTGLADGAQSPALTGDRRPLYRLRKSDQLEINFTFSPEFNQLVSIQPDGFITLRGVPQIYGQGLTVPELVGAIRVRYSSILNDPEVAIVLKDFDKPYFLVGGEVAHPGKYELRDDITLTEALMVAGGFTSQSKHSQVVLFRDVSDNTAQSRLVNVKSLLNKRDLAEDVHIESGDFLYVPKNEISKIKPYLPTSSLSLYANPQAF